MLDQLRVHGRVEILHEGVVHLLDSDDLVVNEVPREGWVVESGHGVTIALDIELTAELMAEGIARDVVRIVQQARKDAAFDVTDRISLIIEADSTIRAALRAHESFVAHETLARAIDFVTFVEDGFSGFVDNGTVIKVKVIKC